VRQTTQSVKTQMDELVRALNPKYAVAQLVNPSFRWAQNNTSVFLNVKYSTRWNAPGAVEVNNAMCDFTKGSFNFTGIGEHSNLKYKYELALDLFDYIIPEKSTWSAGSVGRLSIILRKKWARKWQRLLVDKKQKISNMHVWTEYQDTHDLDKVPNANNSPLSCVFMDMLYCFAKDKCVAPDRCSEECNQSTATADSCTGRPSKGATISFTDTAMVKNDVAGTFTIKSENAFDVDTFEIYWASADATRSGLIASIPFDTEATFELKEPQSPKDTHVMVVPVNSFGEYAGTQGIVEILDAYLPLQKLGPILLTDTNPESGKLSGTLTILESGSTEEPDYNQVTLYWGRSKTTKIKTGALIKSHTTDNSNKIITVTLTSEKIPSGAKYILVYPTNKHGEGAEPGHVAIDDISGPCSADTADNDDCLKEIGVSADTNSDADKVTFQLTIAALPKDISKTTHVVVYFGDHKCDPKGSKSGGAINELSLDELQSMPQQTMEFTNVELPPTATVIQVYTRNQHGESTNCVSADLIDYRDDGENGRINHAARVMSHMIKSDKGAIKILKKTTGYTGDGQKYEELVPFMEDVFLNDRMKAEFTDAMHKFIDKKEAKSKKKAEKKKEKAKSEKHDEL